VINPIAPLELARLDAKTFVFPACSSLDQLIANHYRVIDRRALIEHFPIAQVTPRKFRIELIECSFQGCSTADVIVELKAMNLVPATLAHTLYTLRRDSSFIDHRPLICLGSLWTDPSGIRHAPLINLDPDYLLLSVLPLDDAWWDPCILHAVRA
jgi:hypothetical protein